MDWIWKIDAPFYIFLIIFIWAYYREQVKSSDESNETLNKKIWHQQGEIKELRARNIELQNQMRKDLHIAIYNEVKHTKKQKLWADMSYDEIADMVFKHAKYIPIESIQDISSIDIKKAIKTAWCAERGLLDYCQIYDIYGDKLFRISINGTRIFLSDEEIKMMDQNNYDFILDVVEEEMAQDVHPEYDDEFYFDINDLIFRTVEIANRIRKEAPDSFLIRTDIACCDTILLSMFVIRALCISQAQNDERVEEFEKRFIPGVLGGIVFNHQHLEHQLNEILCNRMDLYEDALLYDNYDEKEEALAFAFECVIKTDYLEQKYVHITNRSPLAILPANKDMECKIQINALLRTITKFVSPYLQRVQASLK